MTLFTLNSVIESKTRNPKSPGCCRAVLDDTTLQHCVVIGGGAAGLADGGPSFCEGEQEGVL